ncbi:MAG: phage tail sheath subtilisin-like domain-containing protein [Alphaproteobacteria bacterium]|nr:phage tail sheath subtilisin-like domain-containing protein [Alphaproteobacteria bacterium]
MTINFKNIPTGIRVPMFYAELDNSQANTASVNQRALIIGQITSAGIAAANVPLISQGASDAKTQGGPGSMLALMTDVYRDADNYGEVWYLPLADDGAAVAATGSITFAGTATANGTLALYIAAYMTTTGVKGQINTAVTTGMTAAEIATAVAAAINANTDLPVTAAVDGSNTAKVDITAKNAGLAGNDIDIRFNYYGAPGGEALPAGIAPTITAMSGGTTNPSLTTALSNLSDMLLDFIAFPYTDTASLDAIKGFLGDTSGRWAWSSQIYGGAFGATRGTLGTLTTFGTARNDQHASIMGFDDSPTPNWLWAANITAAAAQSLRADPALPLQTLVLGSVLAPPVASRFPLTSRNTLLYDGISTFSVADDGTVAIENLITTYQTNSFGQPDNSYLQVETLYTLMAVLRFLKTRITSKYARVKLVDNGTRLPPGANAVSPNMIRSDQIAAYTEMINLGWVENLDGFKAGLIVERDAQNPSRVNELFDPYLMGGLRIFALLAQFRLQ